MAINKIKVTKKKIKIKTKAKAKSSSTSKAISSSKSTGNIVNINVPQPKKRQYTRRQQSKTSQPSSTTSVVTQIHQLPIPQYPMIMPEMLGTINLKNAQLQGELGLVRNNTINNGTPIEIGGNQDRKILTSADKVKAEQENISRLRAENLLNRLNAIDNIPVPSMKESPIRKLSPQRDTKKTFSQLENEAKQKGLDEPGTPSIFNMFMPNDLKRLRKTKTLDTSIFEPLLFKPIDNSVEEHRKYLLNSMAKHEAGLKQTNKDEDALYGYKKDGTPKKKTGRKTKSD